MQPHTTNKEAVLKWTFLNFYLFQKIIINKFIDAVLPYFIINICFFILVHTKNQNSSEFLFVLQKVCWYTKVDVELKYTYLLFIL